MTVDLDSRLLVKFHVVSQPAPQTLYRPIWANFRPPFGPHFLHIELFFKSNSR